jgi:predicted dehydrogenase
MTYDVAIIGTGPDPDDPDESGYAMAYRHAPGYRRLDDCRLVACADIVPENAAAFADRFDLDRSNVFEEYERLLEAVEPDVVSVCVPPSVHEEIVVGCAESGVVRAVHCEKPMADTWDGCRRMVRAARDNGVQLTINHQRRFATPVRRARDLLDDGEIGALRRVEVGGENLYDYGAHLFDLCDFFTGEADVQWVLAGLDYTEENRQFGTHNENRAVAHWRYEDGVHGLASTGEGSALPCDLRLTGTDGVVDLGVDDGPPIRIRSPDTSGWRAVDTGGDGFHRPAPDTLSAAARKLTDRLPLVSTVPGLDAQPTYIERGIADLVAALEEGREPALAAENALRATELIFACWESARRTGRVDLPLEVTGNPLEAMVDSGQVLQSAAPSGGAGRS